MSFLAPWALLWLGSIPVLLWLWRLAATHRQVQVPSLVPFEHLLKRPPRRRTHLIVNVLFWLQLVALIGLTLVLAQPVFFRPHAKTILIILDTSASMGARLRGAGAFEQAKQALRRRIVRKPPAEQVFIMTTAPMTALIPQPTNDGVALARAVDAVRVSHLGGNLATTVRIGRALLAAPPDETLILTDEPRPTTAPSDRVQWRMVGTPLPNVAIVGLDALGPLCAPSQAHVVTTVHNFSRESVAVTLTASQGPRRLVEVSERLGPLERRALSLALPESTNGGITLALTGGVNGLAVDDRAWIDVHQSARLPVVIQTQAPALTRTLSTWLDACPSLPWTTAAAPGDAPYLLMTDRSLGPLGPRDQFANASAMANWEEARPPRAAAAMVFMPPSAPQPVLSYWAAADHPISAYLGPLELVAVALNRSHDAAPLGLPIVSALVDGQKVPVIVAGEDGDHRVVTMRVDPSSSADSTPVLLAFFNSLSWLMGQADMVVTGQPVTLTAFASGTVRVQRPDGSNETVPVARGRVHYEPTTLAGVYRFSQGPSEVRVGVNFVDPLESNVLDRASTWRAVEEAAPLKGHRPRVAHPLAPPLMVLLLVLLLIEWRLYCHAFGAQGSPARRSPGPGRAGLRATAPSPKPPAPSFARK